MRLTRLSTVTVMCVVFAVVAPASNTFAWGPRAIEGIARTTARVLPPALGAPLRGYEDELVAGASISEAELLQRFPHYRLEDPILIVDAEIDLLRAATAHEVSPYLAYRMGVLGQFVAAMNQPFFIAPGSRADARLKQRYEADADAVVGDIPYKSAKRQYIVDVRAYFQERRGYLEDAEALIVSDYNAGVGFKGYGKRSLEVHFSNAINAVADVWYTVLGEETVPAARPATEAISLRDYTVDAIGFYLQRDDDDRADTAFASLERAGALDADTLKEAADEFYENARYARAIPMYRTVLEKSPRRTDVRKRISDYFFSEGLALLEQKKYEEAERAFDEVLRSDTDRGDAREKKLEAARLMAERNERFALTRKRVENAGRTAADAARAEAQRKFAEAVALYRTAGNTYRQVGDEFEDEFLVASGAARQIEAKIERLKTQLVEEVRALQYGAVKEQAIEAIQGSSERGLRTFATRLVQDEHSDKLKSIRARLIEEEKGELRR